MGEFVSYTGVVGVYLDNSGRKCRLCVQYWTLVVDLNQLPCTSL